MDTLSYVVACNILNLRARAGLSRLALASEAGIGQDTLHDIEHACINSSVRTIDKIADALGVPSYQLFAGWYPPHSKAAPLIEFLLKAL